MTTPAYILLDDQITPTVRRYENPVEIISVDRPEDIEEAFDAIQFYHQSGAYIAGYMAYELGYALEPKLKGLMPARRSGPLLQFGVFAGYTSGNISPSNDAGMPPLNLRPYWTEAEYTERFKRVIAYIEAGDVYQINLTFPLTGEYGGEADRLYAALRHRQPARFGGVISLGGPDIISLSPELFFAKAGDDITLRPMKGTARRQADPVQDAALRDAMTQDAKSRAENLMIVDLLRNDVSRLAVPGSVKVPELFALETYPTLHQMTSQVRARLRPDVAFRDLVQSLFPCGSITGAPKIRAMEIIRELEVSPRGAYCGAMGYLDPGGDACFNVAIRTLTLSHGQITYNVGSGLVLDSQAKDEYEECLLKAKVLAASGPDLIETFRWVPGVGALRAGHHKARLSRSAEALGYPLAAGRFDEAVADISAGCAQRVRLVLSAEGKVTAETTDFEPVIDKWRVAMSKKALTPEVQETRYKVSARRFYDEERRRIHDMTGCDEVLFFNENGELCEGSFTSVFVERGGVIYTPDLSCGLLPGVLRGVMIENGEAVAARLGKAHLCAADRLFVGNSLRGLIEVELISDQQY